MVARRDWPGYAWAAGSATICTVAGLAIGPPLNLVNVAMAYLLGVVLVAVRHSTGPAILASVLGVAAFDYFFVPPQGAFTVDDMQYVFTFSIMVAVAVLVSRLMERIRRQAREQAALALEAETQRIRSTLLASISHDLRTPLAVLTGASSSLAESGERMSSEDRRALAQSVFDQSREISEHVAKVLQMTRLETRGIALERDWASLAEIADSVLTRLRERMAQHRVLLELPEDLPLVRVDAPLVEQVLANLLENAAKHTPPETVVRLRAEVVGRELLVTVQDYGGGLAEGDLERVFEKFHRGSTEASVAGIGLGLAIARAIVHLHGGRAWAERIPAGGTAFHFTLPVEDAPQVPMEVSPA